LRIFANPNYDFIRWRWHALAASLVLTIIGIYVAFFHHGLPLGVEFTGGTVITADFVQPVDEGKVRAAIDPISKNAVVQKIGDVGQNRVMLRLPCPQVEQLGASL